MQPKKGPLSEAGVVERVPVRVDGVVKLEVLVVSSALALRFVCMADKR